MPTVQLRRRLLTTNTTASAYAITAGMYTLATLATALSVTEAVAAEMIVPMGQVRDEAVRKRGIEVLAIGVGADNATTGFRVWQVKRSTTTSRNVNGDFELALLYSVACTLSSAVGATGGVGVLSTERIADTLTVTRATSATSPAGHAELVETVYGAVAGAALSTTGNVPGRFYLPDVGGGDVLIEPIVGTATSANVLVEAQT